MGGFTRMLFGGMGGGMGGGYGGGIGLLEIILIGGGIFLFIRFLRNRQAPAYQESYGGPSHSDEDPYGVGGSSRGGDSSGGVYLGPDIDSSRGSGSVAKTYAANNHAEEGFPGILAADSTFSRENFLLDVRENFLRFHDAWVARDLLPIRELLDSDIFEQCQRDLERLKSEGRINKLDGFEILSIKIVESWQEESRDFIAVAYGTSLLDYLVSESTGQVLEGSPATPVCFTEQMDLGALIKRQPLVPFGHQPGVRKCRLCPIFGGRILFPVFFAAFPVLKGPPEIKNSS